MTTYKNTGEFPVHAGGLSVGAHAHVTRADEEWGTEGDDRPALYDLEGAGVVLFPGDTVDTDAEIVSGIIRPLNAAGEVVDIEAAAPADAPEPAAEPTKKPKTPADASAPTKE